MKGVAVVSALNIRYSPPSPSPVLPSSTLPSSTPCWTLWEAWTSHASSSPPPLAPVPLLSTALIVC